MTRFPRGWHFAAISGKTVTHRFSTTFRDGVIQQNKFLARKYRKKKCANLNAARPALYVASTVKCAIIRHQKPCKRPYFACGKIVKTCRFDGWRGCKRWPLAMRKTTSCNMKGRERHYRRSYLGVKTAVSGLLICYFAQNDGLSFVDILTCFHDTALALWYFDSWQQR